MVCWVQHIQKERRQMNSFVECSIAMQNFLMILLEICLILELILFLLRIILFFREKESDNGNNCFCRFHFVLMVSLMNEHRYMYWRKCISANASGLSGQYFNIRDCCIDIISLLGNLEGEIQI